MESMYYMTVFYYLFYKAGWVKKKIFHVKSVSHDHLNFLASTHVFL
jgi:hypothetical protein